MNLVRRLARGGARPLLTAAALVVAAAIPGAAGAGHGDTPSIPSYTGCVGPLGALIGFAQGETPLAVCGTRPRVHLSGGDITGVAVGTGLSGGGTEGPASIGIATQFCDVATASVAYGFGQRGQGFLDCVVLDGRRAIQVNGFPFVPLEQISFRLRDEDCPPGQFVTGVDDGLPVVDPYLKCDPAPSGAGLPSWFDLSTENQVTYTGSEGRLRTVTGPLTIEAGGGPVRIESCEVEDSHVSCGDATFDSAQVGGCFYGPGTFSCSGGGSWSGVVSASAANFGSCSLNSGRISCPGGATLGSPTSIGSCTFSGGSFSCPGPKPFRIDHPLDPANKWLYHAAIESPEVLNAYSGNVTTNTKGVAVVRLPRYFEALNRDFRYQLTVIGSFAQAIVAKEIEGNRFTIRTSKPGVKVSWQVTGVRNDPYARAHPLRVEVAKTAR